MIISSTANLSIVNIRLQEAVVAFNRYFEFMKIEPEQDAVADKQSSVVKPENCQLQIKDLNFRFIGRKEIFSYITLNPQAKNLFYSSKFL